MPAFASGSYPDNPALGPAGTDGAIENPPLDGGGGATSAGSQTDNPPLDGAAETAGAATMIANPPLEDDSAPDHAGNGENDDDGDDLGDLGRVVGEVQAVARADFHDAAGEPGEQVDGALDLRPSPDRPGRSARGHRICAAGHRSG